MLAKTPWIVDAYATEKGESPAWSFMMGLQGRDKAEAIALVKLLEEQGNALRRPQSGTLGQGLFELRGKQIGLSQINRVFLFLAHKNRAVIPLFGADLKK